MNSPIVEPLAPAAILELRSATKAYGSGPSRVEALRDVTLTLRAGELTVFSGPSGSGKTTLLNLIGCLDRPTSGDVLVEGRSTKALGRRALAHLRAAKIGFVFQAFNLVPVLSALENVELALELAGRRDQAREAALEALREVGLVGLDHRRPSELSGGQQQRVAIARALAKRPLLVIADEPTANLDSANGEQIVELMQALNRTMGTTFVLSSHDPRVVGHARRVVTLRDGSVVSDTSR